MIIYTDLVKSNVIFSRAQMAFRPSGDNILSENTANQTWSSLNKSSIASTFL